MLIIGRKPWEVLVLDVAGERIIVTVTEIRGGKCRLGVQADKERVIVRRGELVKEMR